MLGQRIVYRANILEVCPKRETDAFLTIRKKAPTPSTQQPYQTESTSQGVLFLNTSFGIASAYHLITSEVPSDVKATPSLFFFIEVLMLMLKLSDFSHNISDVVTFF